MASDLLHFVSQRLFELFGDIVGIADVKMKSFGCCIDLQSI